MKKVRIYQQKNRPGYYIQWRENGRRITKQCNTKAEADHFAHFKYMQINSDVYTSLDLPWEDVKAEYLQKYDLRGLESTSKEEAARSLANFERFCKPRSSRAINQRMVNWFILERQKECKSKYTLNKDISNIRALLNWLKKNNCHPGNIEIGLVKAPPIYVKALTSSQIRQLLKACPDSEWYIRVLLSLCTGLRSGDIDHIQLNQIDLGSMTVLVIEKKTSRQQAYPLPDLIKPILEKYLDDRNTMFSSDNKSTLHKQWLKLRPEKITRQDLRKTNKSLLQTIGSIGSVQELLHSDLRVTERFYTDRELILRWKVNHLPVEAWLKKDATS